ncbi:MAG: MlaA family lipoprotein [Mariprofundus sp.]|nr:MlaA family lipoprotein [Mariprofundus sp.]
MLTSCATTQNHHDPIESTNRVTDKVNDSIDRVSLKPLAKGYTAVVPKPMRTAVSNFYDNSTYMNTVLNDFLQGKGQQGFLDLMRFLINSTLGIGGLVDVASSMGFESHEEDFGQTLATWGVGQGTYIVYPLMGPNSARNTSDFLTATATDPLFWAGFVLAPYVTIPVTVLKYIDERAQLLSASDMRDELSLDPYIFTREAWRQRREYLIYDGNPPTPLSEDDGFEEDDFEDDDFDSEPTQPKTRIRLDSTPPDDIAAPIPPASVSSPTPQGAQIQLQSDITTAPLTSKLVSVHRKYVLFLSSHYSEAEAAAEQGHIAKLGVHSDIYPVTLDHRKWYRLRAGSYTSKAEATAAMNKLKTLTGLTGAWLEISNGRDKE